MPKAKRTDSPGALTQAWRGTWGTKDEPHAYLIFAQSELVALANGTATDDVVTQARSMAEAMGLGLEQEPRGGSPMHPLIAVVGAVLVALLLTRAYSLLSRERFRVSGDWLHAYRQSEREEFHGVSWRWPVRYWE